VEAAEGVGGERKEGRRERGRLDEEDWMKKTEVNTNTALRKPFNF
jgi:hypothetical protein